MWPAGWKRHSFSFCLRVCAPRYNVKQRCQNTPAIGSVNLAKNQVVWQKCTKCWQENDVVKKYNFEKRGGLANCAVGRRRKKSTVFFKYFCVCRMSIFV